MSGAQIQAIALLVAEATKAGVSVAQILRDARDNGGVSDDKWAEINAAIDGAENAWEGR